MFEFHSDRRRYFEMQIENAVVALISEVKRVPAYPEHVAVQLPDSKAQAAVNEIMSHAVPATSPRFHEPMTKDETVVAVRPSPSAICWFDARPCWRRCSMIL